MAARVLLRVKELLLDEDRVVLEDFASPHLAVEKVEGSQHLNSLVLTS